MGYSFFFSYASTDDRGSQGRVRWFYDRLWENLQVVHGKLKEPFFALRGIEAGQNWKRALVASLNSSSVLVCLQSTSYFQSDVCGQEFEIFLQRRKPFAKRGEDPPDCIIPVLWHPIKGDLPKAFPDYFQGTKPSDDLVPFKEDGLYRAILNDQTQGKENIIRYALNLAERISNLLGRNLGDRALLPLDVVPDLERIPNAFGFPAWPLPDIDQEKGTGPNSITFVYPCDVPPEALPFSPPPPNAVISAAALAKSHEWIFQGVGFNGREDFLAKLEKIQNAQQKRSPVVLMLTEKTLLGDLDLLERFEQIPGNGKATLLLTTSSGGELPADFPATLRSKVTLISRDRFDDLLIDKLGRLRDLLKAEPTAETTGSMVRL